MHEFIQLFYNLITYITTTIGNLGYIGIFLLMFLESSFFPFPSEIIIIPAGYLAYQGEFNLLLVIANGILGSVAGAVFNYYLAKKLGLVFLRKFGKYILINPASLKRIEIFFNKYGRSTTFFGRLLPGVRQYISLPAGLANMNLKIFILFTALGSAIWVSLLAILGYTIGDQQNLIKEYLHIVLIAISICTLLYFAITLLIVRIKN